LSGCEDPRKATKRRINKETTDARSKLLALSRLKVVEKAVMLWFCSVAALFV